MPVSKTIAKQLENASWIRRMFEEGVRLKRERGADAALYNIARDVVSFSQ
jgi:hypothetical protein